MTRPTTGNDHLDWLLLQAAEMIEEDPVDADDAYQQATELLEWAAGAPTRADEELRDLTERIGRQRA